MALPKYTDPAIQNQTQDEATDYPDNLNSLPIIPGNNGEDADEKNMKKDKIKGYKEGTKDDTLTEDEELNYDDVEGDFSEDENPDEEDEDMNKRDDEEDIGEIDTESYGKDLS